jgi:hypothetical protein
MRKVLGTLLLLAISSAALGDEASQCQASAGTYRSGIVVKGPKFAHGQFRKGVELSHTHLKLMADQDGQVYDVAIDNVFADGYVKNSRRVPDSLYSIKVHDHLELCGQLYTKGVGIHWVHTNCGQKPTASHPNGWIKHIAANGTSGQNLEDNTQFCSLF